MKRSFAACGKLAPVFCASPRLMSIPATPIVRRASMFSAILASVLGVQTQIGHTEAVVTGSQLEPPQGVMVWVQAPPAVRKGATFVLKIKILNASAAAFSFKSINVADRYMRGFDVVGIDPAPINVDRTLGDLEMLYDLSMKANEEWQVRVRLRATGPGAFIGDVDVEFNGTSYTRTAQTRVK